jgi:3D-(3,5/4)-trihydroxycyclohexane-1,2-dione acylhydrolase (decyclizing)
VRSVRLTTAGAIVRFLVAQRSIVDGRDAPLFPGVFAIFGHGNVIGLGAALHEARSDIPTYRGQNEQGMALAAVGFAKAARRRQIMVATSSIGPGATNMVTAAAVAHANRLPILLLAGDSFHHRVPDPVLQQVEHFDAPSTTVNDAFRAVTRFWDRITCPEQVVQSLPLAVETMLDPASCGPAFLALPQDVQVEMFDYPVAFFETHVHQLRRPRPDVDDLRLAAERLRAARRPLVISGGGVHYSDAGNELTTFLLRHELPVVETVAGRSAVLPSHPGYIGPLGVTGSDAANALVAEADVILAVGTRLQDFTTGSWTIFGSEASIVGLNVNRFDATKHRSTALICDAREGLTELSALLSDWKASGTWRRRTRRSARQHVDEVRRRVQPDQQGATGSRLPTYAQVIGAVNRFAGEDDYVVTSAGGLPGELNMNWMARGTRTFDCEYGFSCMGYEIAGAWGARIARDAGDVIALVGDGSYLMMNSDLYSSVLHGQKLIVVLCDNGGYAAIERLQVGQGGASFNNMLGTVGARSFTVDWVAHSHSLGCLAEAATNTAALEAALVRAREADRTTVIVVTTDPDVWSDGGAFWEVGVPSSSRRRGVRDAYARLVEGKRRQRVGW